MILLCFLVRISLKMYRIVFTYILFSRKSMQTSKLDKREREKEKHLLSEIGKITNEMTWKSIVVRKSTCFDYERERGHLENTLL